MLTNWWRWGWCWLFDAVSSWILAITDTWRPMERGQYRDLVSSSLVVISQVSSWSQSHKAILDNFLNILGFYLARGEATGWEAISKGGESWTQPLQVPNWKSVLEKKQYNNTIRIFLTMRFPGYPCNNLGKFWTNRVYSSEKPRLDGGLTRLEDNPISICPENQDWACGQGLYWIQWLHFDRLEGFCSWLLDCGNYTYFHIHICWNGWYPVFISSFLLLLLFFNLSPIIIYPFRNWLTHSLTAVPHSFITCFMAFLDILVQKNGC